MTRIICREPDCVFWEDGICGADEIEYDPEAGGCLTFEDADDLPLDEDLNWDDETEEEDDDDDYLDDDDDWEEEDDWDDDEDDLYAQARWDAVQI
jgi:hypothetical protein